jgi:HTH-type transcriptional regulator/antitoxin HigA
LIPKERLDSFAARHRPFYSKIKILQFAQRMRIHPGIVNGQLQHAGEIPWQANREMLSKIRNLVSTTAITDGWGKTIEI